MGNFAKMKRRLMGGGEGGPKKIGVMLAMPSSRGWSRTEQVQMAALGGAFSVRPDFPFMIEPFSLLYKEPVDLARNLCVRHFLEKTTHEYLAFWDHDAIPPPDFWGLFGKGDIVSGVTFMWDGQREPLKRIQFNQFRIDSRGKSNTVVPTMEEMSLPSYEVDIVGTHCMVIRRRVFEKLGPSPFKIPLGPDGVGLMGEDMYFCRAARAAGFKIQIIPSMSFEHLKEVGLSLVWESCLHFLEGGKKAGYALGYEHGKAGRPSALQAAKEKEPEPAKAEPSAFFLPEETPEEEPKGEEAVA